MSDLTTDGDSPLRGAIRRGDIILCETLVAQRAECSGDVDVAGWTLLHLASNIGRLDIAVLLLKHGARCEVNHVAVTGDTACHLAASSGYGPVVLELSKEGADVTIRNNKGRDVLQEAERNQHWNLLKQLQEMTTSTR